MGPSPTHPLPMEPQTAPDIELPATGGKRIKLRDFKGRGVVLYFYPKDSTPGCTTEGQDFSELHRTVPGPGLGCPSVSRDSVKSHENFKAKLGLPFDLLADGTNGVRVVRRHETEKHVWQTGAGHRAQHLRHRAGWRHRPDLAGVKVPNHAQEVLEFVRTLG
jgi:peroxiredoxin Q/BCP